MSSQPSDNETKQKSMASCKECSGAKICTLHNRDSIKDIENDDSVSVVNENAVKIEKIDKFDSPPNISKSVTDRNINNDSEDAKVTNKVSQEGSPFKSAVKDFVIKKLSKNVNSSHLLSGLSEKIVKKLEDGKELKPILVNVGNESDAEPLDSTTNISAHELKSFAANDYPETPNVELASECFEEHESSVDETSDMIDFKKHLSSISLPSSPAGMLNSSFERFDKIQDMKLIDDVLSTKVMEKDSFVEESVEEIELQKFQHQRTDSIFQDGKIFDFAELKDYPRNAYISIYPDKEKPSFKHTFGRYLNAVGIGALKQYIFSLSLPQMFLLALLIIHNSEFLSTYCTFIIDAIIIAYICYDFICIQMEQKITEASITSQTQEASIVVEKKKSKVIKGRVKILRGDYDPKMVKKHPTDTVDIFIEDNCLKLCNPKKSDSSDDTELSISYDISDAKIAIVPWDLSKKKIWKKNYPICVILPPYSKGCHQLDEHDSEEIPAPDYLTFSLFKDALVETVEHRALHIFALSHREKESLFWTLYSNVRTCEIAAKDQTVSVYGSLKKMDLIGMELSENDNESANFNYYMQVLFERSLKIEPDVYESYPVEWLNIVLGRVFYDFLTQEYWLDKMKGKIQKQLDKIEMPAITKALKVCEICFGESIPKVFSVTRPTMDSCGVWFNFDFEYSGSFQMTVEARLNIVKTRDATAVPLLEDPTDKNSMEISDSSDEEESDKKSNSPKKNKIFNKLEKWISHKHFQTVAQSNFVKRYVGDITNVALTLAVEVNSLNGTLTVNIPPVPTDRIWYGFQKDPDLSLKVYPKFGKHEININAVVQMIEKKLKQEFKKVLVLPNMDDLIIPVMYSPLTGH